MAKAVVVVVEIDGATKASTDGRLLVTDAATASMPANAAAVAAVGRLTIVVLRENEMQIARSAGSSLRLTKDTKSGPLTTQWSRFYVTIPT